MEMVERSASNTVLNRLSEFIAMVKEDAEYAATTYDIPLTLLIAIAAHESDFGKSDLAVNHNNYFGVEAVKNQKRTHDGRYREFTSRRGCFLSTAGLLASWLYNLSGRKATSAVINKMAPMYYLGKKWDQLNAHELIATEQWVDAVTKYVAGIKMCLKRPSHGTVR